VAEIGFKLLKRTPGVSLEEVEKTAAPLLAQDEIPEMVLVEEGLWVKII